MSITVMPEDSELLNYDTYQLLGMCCWDQMTEEQQKAAMDKFNWVLAKKKELYEAKDAT